MTSQHDNNIKMLRRPLGNLTKNLKSMRMYYNFLSTTAPQNADF
jgi:hypothetical protein